MVDTIVFQIYDLVKHEQLVKILERDGVEGISTYVENIEKTNVDLSEAISNIVGNSENEDSDSMLTKVVEVLEGHQAKRKDDDFERVKRIHNKRFAYDHETNKSFRAKYVNHLRSSHYDLAYRIDYAQDFIYFNFSIPKYLFGSNILQFVPHHFDKDYYGLVGNWDQVEELTYNRLKRFISWFCGRELADLVKLEEFRLVQIDLCYNKVFNTKSESLAYLNELKRIRKKWLRNTSRGNTTYHSGIHFPGREMTLKIYHKGSEFRNNDRNEVKAFLSEQSVEFMQDFADRILRYEVSFRQPYFNRVYKEKLFRKGAGYWKRAKMLFKAISSNGYVMINGKKCYAISLPPEDKKLYKYAKYIMGKSFYFNIKSDSKFGNDDYPVSLANPDFDRYQRFDRALFRRLQRKFRWFYNFFKVTFKHDFMNVLGDIESKFPKYHKERSEELRRRYLIISGVIPSKQLTSISFNKCKNIVNLLNDGMSWPEIKENGLISDSKFYLYKKFFNAFGVGEIAATQQFTTGSEDFRDYYDLVERNASKLGIDGLLKSAI